MSEFHSQLSEEQRARARVLRRESTFPERKLWNALRGSQLCGLKFRRQHPIGPFFVDYYCHDQRLAIELDGASHDNRGQYDLERERYLKSLNLRIVRFGNDDVLRDLDNVLRAILLACGLDPDTGEPLSSTTSRGAPSP
jgi:very-short-patch-repair endonuclease